MSKSTQRAKRPSKREKRAMRRAEHGNAVEMVPGINPELSVTNEKKHRSRTLVCRTDKQKLLLNHIQSKPLTITEGPAGCGKTYVPVRWAINRLLEHEVKSVIFTRPFVLADDDEDDEIGAIPGTLEEKFDPLFRPVKDAILEDMTESHLENLMKLKRIEIAPLAYIRGRTLSDCIVILDEGQNCTKKAFKLLLTRMGENSTLIVNGDLSQMDIKGPSGLKDLMERFAGCNYVGQVIFTEEDCVRSGFVKEVLMRYRD